jgi:hypothetical protein
MADGDLFKNFLFPGDFPRNLPLPPDYTILKSALSATPVVDNILEFGFWIAD